MRKILGEVLNFLKNNKKTLIFFIIPIIVVFVTYGTINQKGTGNVLGSDNTLAKEAEIKRQIKENTEKYHPKPDWLAANPQNLPLSAKSAVILDSNTNQLLYADNEHEKLPPASITKVLTAIVVLENMKEDKLCTISQRAADTEANKITMNAGEKLKVEDLLYGLMMISANDAAEALADCYDGGRDAFMDKMNEKVRVLGLVDTHFVNPNGLHDDNHYSSAYDMATITNYGIRSNPNFLKYFGRKDDYSVYATENNEPHWWQQISNLLQTYSGMDGAKTGFTYEAGNTYIGTAQRGNTRIVIVYFNANSTTYDATTMLDQGFYLSSLQ